MKVLIRLAKRGRDSNLRSAVRQAEEFLLRPQLRPGTGALRPGAAYFVLRAQRASSPEVLILRNAAASSSKAT